MSGYTDGKGRFRPFGGRKPMGSLNIPICAPCGGFLPDHRLPLMVSERDGWVRPTTCHHCGADTTQPGAYLGGAQ